MSNNLPINVDTDKTTSTITYANEVIAIIAGMAAGEVDGVASMTNTSAIADLFGRGKPVTRGVKVEVGTEEASADLMLTVEYGKPVSKVCMEVQESVKRAIESMTGLHVVRVDVHVSGISFEREAQETRQGIERVAAEDGLLPEIKAQPREMEDDLLDSLDSLDEDEIDDLISDLASDIEEE